MNIFWEEQVINYYKQYIDSEKQLLEEKDLFGAMQHFAITRNFAGIGKTTAERSWLSKTIHAVVKDKTLNSEQQYTKLLDRFKRRYKKDLVSAASKILWFAGDKELHVILDTRAVAAISKIANCKITGEGHQKYKTFVEMWVKLFEKHESEIAIASNKVKNFYLSCKDFNSAQSVVVMDQRWFHMRVLDMYLWNYSDLIKKSV